MKWENQNSLCNEQYLIKDEEVVISIYDSKGGALLTKELKKIYINRNPNKRSS